MEFRVLGSLTPVDAGRGIALTSAHQRRLRCRLAAGPEVTDAARFERLAARGRSAAHAADRVRLL
jgi:hypothetical protein